jgi:phosphate-selective porin OprO/OprP
MGGIRYRNVAVAWAATVALAPRLAAQQEQHDSTSLEARVDQLDQQVRILQRLRELAADSAAAAAKDKVSATASGKDGFSIKSADGKYALRLKGLVQADARFFLSDSAFPVTNSFFLRRARPILEATVGKYLEFRLQPDFGQGTTVLFDAYADVKVAPAFAIRAGKFKAPVDLERLQSASDIVFAERALATNLAPNRDVGLQLSGDLDSGLVVWQAGVFNGVPDLGNGDIDVSDAKDFVARVFLQPFRSGSLKGLGVGVAGSTGLERGTPAAPALASYRTPGQQSWFRYTSSTTVTANNVFADGRRQRFAPQAYFYTGPLGLQGEYIE